MGVDGRRCRGERSKRPGENPLSPVRRGTLPGCRGPKHLLPGGKASSQEMQERHFPMWNMLKSKEEEKRGGGEGGRMAEEMHEY